MVPETSTVLVPTWMWSANKVSRVPGGIYQSLVILGIINCAVWISEYYKLASSLCSMYCLYCCCFYLEMALDQESRVLRCLDQQKILSMLLTQVFPKKITCFYKNLQCQMQKQKCKAYSIFKHLQVSHNLLCNQCLCLILKGPRWIGPRMITSIIDISSGN